MTLPGCEVRRNWVAYRPNFPLLLALPPHTLMRVGQASAEMLNGRWFAGRMVLVEYLAPQVSMAGETFRGVLETIRRLLLLVSRVRVFSS